jgi:hypothetical protein
MEVLREVNDVTPVRVLLEYLGPAVYGALPVGVP